MGLNATEWCILRVAMVDQRFFMAFRPQWWTRTSQVSSPNPAERQWLSWEIPGAGKRWRDSQPQRPQLAIWKLTCPDPMDLPMDFPWHVCRRIPIYGNVASSTMSVCWLAEDKIPKMLWQTRHERGAWPNLNLKLKTISLKQVPQANEPGRFYPKCEMNSCWSIKMLSRKVLRSLKRSLNSQPCLTTLKLRLLPPHDWEMLPTVCYLEGALELPTVSAIKVKHSMVSHFGIPWICCGRKMPSQNPPCSPSELPNFFMELPTEPIPEFCPGTSCTGLHVVAM